MTADAAHTAQLAAAIDQIGINLPVATVNQLLAYLALLQRWNRTYNLTAICQFEEMLNLHLLDCLAILPALQRHAGTGALRLLDVGSGGGLPGVVLAVCRPDWAVTCVDSVAKKAGFIRQVAAELALSNLAAVHARVEAMAGPSNAFDLVVSRAFSSLADFVTLTEDRLTPGGVWLAMKGKRPVDEIVGLPRDVEVFHVEPLQVPGLAADRCLVWIRRRPA